MDEYIKIKRQFYEAMERQALEAFLIKEALQAATKALEEISEVNRHGLCGYVARKALEKIKGKYNEKQAF